MLELDASVFDEMDEVDIALICTDPAEEPSILDSLNKPLTYSDLHGDDECIDCRDITPDESDCSPIGEEAEEMIDIDSELLLGDDEEDNELIDLVDSID